jgi:replicative DNA helicase
MIEGVHYSKDFEAAVLGICLMERHAFARTFGLIDERMFYFDDNRKVFQAMLRMYHDQVPLDALTVWEKMMEQEVKLSFENIPWYLSELQRQVVSSAHLEYHCYVIKKFWQKRELERITSMGIDQSEDGRKTAFSITEQINEIFSGEVKKDWQSMDELMFNLIIHQEDIKAGKKEFVSSGLKEIDRLNGGFAPGNMIVIGARPSVGKTALMGMMAINIAKKKKSVGIISLEMNNNEIAGRFAALSTDFTFNAIYRNIFRDEEESRQFYDSITRTAVNLPIYVSDKTRVDINEIRAKAVKLKHAHGLDILMIDYLQLVDSVTGNKNYNREQEVARLSRGIKLMAKDLGIPVVVLCQLSREVTKRSYAHRFPQASDLRESGAIEQDADVILMLHRDWVANYETFEEGERKGQSTEFTADLIGVKWRNGATFHMELEYQPTLMKFVEPKRNSWHPLPPERLYNDQNPF